MAVDKTTLSAACAIDDVKVTVASAATIAVGDTVRIDQELLKVSKGYVVGSTTVPVLRGQEGTVATAHPSGASFVSGAGTDWVTIDGPQVVATYLIAGRGREIRSYSADGALDLPTAGLDAVAVLNGSSQLDMTLSDPTQDLTGSVLWIIGTDGSAHTVTAVTAAGGASSFAGAGSDNNVATFVGSAGICLFVLMAINGLWVPISLLAGSNIADVTITLS